MRRLTLACATAVAAALLGTVLFVPGAPWRLPLAVAGGVWAPGYAVLSAVRPRGLGGLERNALAAGLGLALVPVLGLAASLAGGFDAVAVAALVLAVVALGAGIGAARSRGCEPAPLVHARLPGTAATLAIVSAALLGAGSLWSAPVDEAAPAPASLSVRDAPFLISAPTPVTLTLEGDATRRLVVTVDDAVLLDGPAAPGEVVVMLPAPVGEHRFAAAWAGVEIHFRYEVKA